MFFTYTQKNLFYSEKNKLDVNCKKNNYFLKIDLNYINFVFQNKG